MSAPETLDPQSQANVMMTVLNERLAAAVPVEELSRHDEEGRMLQVFEEPDGSRFVQRYFTRQGVNYVEGERLTFEEAWQALTGSYADADIEVVPSFMFRQPGEDSGAATIISEYVPGLVDVKDLPTQEKVKLAQGLGKLLDPRADFLPHHQAIHADSFKGVKQEDGTHKVLVIDTDPFVTPAPFPGDYRDVYVTRYIKRFSDMIWDQWCDETDRAEVEAALLGSLMGTLEEKEYADMDSMINRAFMNLNLMSNGIDPRGTNGDMLRDF
jgi:hypothetical protein